jgi:iron(III) transport system substrate-binding protein
VARELNFRDRAASAAAAGRATGPRLVPLLLLALGCERASPPTVVVYTSVDQQFAQQVLDQFEQQSGVRVAAVFDSEAGKTTGLVQRLAAEAERPRCDVWWSSEVVGTIELARRDVLAAYGSPAAADIPAEWCDPQHRWTGVAARARVLAFDMRLLKAADLPRTWLELGDPRWARRLAIANPQFGTTRGHFALLWAHHGPAEATRLFQAFRDGGAQIADGNSHAVRLVAAGTAALGMTDTDDVWVAQGRGEAVGLVYPALAPDGPPIWIPCTIALVRGGPNGAAGRRLIDFLVSAEAERLLAASDSRNVPIRAAVRAAVGYAGPAPEPAAFEAGADALPAAMQAARDILLR